MKAKDARAGEVDLSTYNNSWYHPGGGYLKRALWFFTNTILFLNPLNPFSGIKILALRLFGANIGKGVTVKPSVNIKYPWLLEIGDNSWIGEKVWIDNLVKVKIGSNCCLSQRSFLLTGNHDYTRKNFNLLVGEIVLEDGVWIGAGSVVGPGVVCKRHSVLSALSFASQDLEEYKIYRGNPAFVVKDRTIVQ